ncbi:hypothetical protein KM043_016512 [Ampulex compressa]|nr:hypothetical protein KM043_016512 [Ampulex compressa]
MDSNMLKEINYLTRLIEQHKRKSSHKLQYVKKIHPNPDVHLVKPEKCTNFLHKPQQNVTAGGPLQNLTLKFVKNVATSKAAVKKLNNSNVVILSRRKLIRVRRGSKGTTAFSPVGTNKMKRLLQTTFKKTKIIPQKMVKPTLVLNNGKQSVSKQGDSLSSHIIKPKFNKYRIDRTVSQATKVNKREITASKRTINKTMELITIGGIVYKSSKNHLVRRSYSPKKKRPGSIKNDKFIIATNGKKLRRVKNTKEKTLEKIMHSNIPPPVLKLPSNVAQKINHKNIMSNKVKQRSIQILRNKMRKNNQPCLLFQRFGFCANYENGICPKLHDKKQVSLCKKFLQGNCLLSNCQLSHDVGPEKMPTCKYFLEGCCTRDTCPYLHVKVSSTTPICIEFLKGYCAKGHECKQRHECLCPEFDKLGKCSKVENKTFRRPPIGSLPSYIPIN